MKYPSRCSLIRCFSPAGTAWGYGLVWMEATDLLEPLLEGTFCYKMTQGRPSLGVRVCSGARECVRAQGTSLSSTTLNPGAASRLGTHAVPAQPGTAFQPLIYHPITCLFCCICRPFTAAIYQERSQRQKREWWPSAPPPPPDVSWSSLGWAEAADGGRVNNRHESASPNCSLTTNCRYLEVMLSHFLAYKHVSKK